MVTQRILTPCWVWLFPTKLCSTEANGNALWINCRATLSPQNIPHFQIPPPPPPQKSYTASRGGSYPSKIHLKRNSYVLTTASAIGAASTCHFRPIYRCWCWSSLCSSSCHLATSLFASRIGGGDSKFAWALACCWLSGLMCRLRTDIW